MEDLRFANELMAKQNSTPLRRDEDNPDDDYISRLSGDEGIFSCPCLSSEFVINENDFVFP